ncbi:MAG: ATP-binding cassette domain-containing protein [Planctomycetota bacterium]
MPLLSLDSVSIRYQGPPLLEDVDCIIEAKQRIGLLGRNGAGKSTLFRLLTGQTHPDHGNIAVAGDAQIALLPQAVPDEFEGSVQAIVASGIQELPGQNLDDWEKDHLVEKILSRMELEPGAEVHSMSAGMKRRVLLARALVQSPDLLLLDEPTNHLDIEAITWLEDFLARYDQGFIFITHDRKFLRKLADRILEIDRGRLFDWSCNYDTFLKRKEEQIAAQEKQDKLFDKKLAEEEVWIRQGIKARRTRNEGRVRALKELRRIRSERPNKTGTSNLQIQEGARSGNLVLRAEQLHFHFESETERGGPEILGGFGCTIMRGDKIGIIGPNGVGKTTLLRVLLGKLEPKRGKIKLGANLELAYFDQLRGQLDPEKTIEEEVADGYQTIQINGNSKHVLGYLQDFLFSPERARTKIRFLSGGETNRILLAKLFAKPANVIVLDEPTNDLDAETLELLEARLVDFQGTVLTVSHDREFLNNIATSCFVFEPQQDGSAQVREYVGGYDDWLRQRPQSSPTRSTNQGEKNAQAKQKLNNDSIQGMDKKPRKLTFKETKELDELPGKIESHEVSIAQVHQEMADPEFYKQDASSIATKQEALKQLEAELAEFYTRWEELESLQ